MTIVESGRPSDFPSLVLDRITGLAKMLRRFLLPTIAILACLILWEVLAVFTRIPAYLLPQPSNVIVALVQNFPFLMGHAWVTTVEIVLGFLLSIAIGIPIAMAIVGSRWIEDAVYPLLVLSQAVPKVALAPLLLVWIGFGIETKVVVAVLIAFFPVVIGAAVGFKSVPQEMVHLGRSMGLTGARMFTKIRLPYALPSIFGGLKVSITLAVVGAVVGEFVGADRGLGYLILLYSGQLEMALMFAAIFVLVAIGIVSFAIVQFAERALIPWHASVRNDLLGA